MKTKIILLISLFSFAHYSQSNSGSVSKSSSETRFLTQVFIKEQKDLSFLNSLKIPVYARMENSVVAECSSADLTLISIHGYYSKNISSAPANGIFYLVFPPFDKTTQEVQSQVSRFVEILVTDTDAFFVRAEPQEAEKLIPLQFHIARVWMTPIYLESFINLPSPPKITAYNPVIKWIIDQITVGEVSRWLRDLTGENPTIVRGRTDTIRTRWAPAPKNSSGIWYFYEKAQTFTGIDSVAFHSFRWSTYTDSNVIATKIGRVYPRRQYIMGGHIDCTSEQPSTWAPGADDNGSGTIAALVAAKYIRTIPFRNTIKLMAFNAEEFGLYGSARYASEARVRGDSILGMLNGDMIGTEFSNFDSVRVYTGTRAGSIALGNKFYEMNTTYAIGLKVRRSTSSPGNSDHASFWNNGYDAIHVFEDDFSPVYHTTGDRISAMDTVYWTKVIKCMVATLCDLAVPDTIFTGTELIPASSQSTTLQIGYPDPNPFRGTTSIKFTIPTRTKIEVSLYNLTGQLIRKLTEETKEAGTHTILWDGKTKNQNVAPSGVYFIKFTAGDMTTFRRLVKIQ